MEFTASPQFVGRGSEPGGGITGQQVNFSSTVGGEPVQVQVNVPGHASQPMAFDLVKQYTVTIEEVV